MKSYEKCLKKSHQGQGIVFETRVQDGLCGIDLGVRENRLSKKSQQEKWELNQSSCTGNVNEKTDERNIVEIKSICLGDWMKIGEAKAGEKQKSMIGLLLQSQVDRNGKIISKNMDLSRDIPGCGKR